MPDEVKFTKEVFLQRERDILKKHRMPTDIAMDDMELLKTKLPGNNGNGEVTPVSPSYENG